MQPLEIVLVGISLAIIGFVGFSLLMHYRYATQIVDMLPFYSGLALIPLILFGFIGLTAIWFSPITFIGLAITAGVSLLLQFPVYNWRQEYSIDKFKEFLKGLLHDQFSIIDFDDYVEGRIDTERVNVILRHDVDISLPRAVRMAEIQKDHGVQATYFFRLHAEKYTIDDARSIVRMLDENGFKIGLHYETLSLTNGDRKKAIELFEEDLEKLREESPVNVVAAHGQKDYKNREIWDDVDKDRLGISSAYDMKYDLYLSDAGGKRLRGKDGKYLFDRIYEAKPGQIVQILIHPDWWS